VSRAQERHEPTLGLGSGIAAVAAPDLPVDDRRPHALFAPPVGGIDAVGGEEREQGVAFVAQVLDEAAVGVVGMGLLEEQVEALPDVEHRLGPAILVEVPGGEGLQQKRSRTWRGVPRAQAGESSIISWQRRRRCATHV